MTPRRLIGLLALAIAATAPCGAFAGPGDDDSPPPKPTGPVSEAVTLTTEDGMTIAATYWPAGPRVGAPPPPPSYERPKPQGAPPPAAPLPPAANTPAVVFVHMEDSTKEAFLPLIPRFVEHRVSAIGIDLRGHGASEVQGGKNVRSRVLAKEEEFYATMHNDVKAAVQWLKARGHDPARIGAIGAGLGASIVMDAVRQHPEDWSVVMLLTPQLGYPAMPIEPWIKSMTGPVAGNVQIVILSSVEDGDKGPRKLLYSLEYARDAPPKTPDRLKSQLRRGVYPRTRFLPETGATGTGMFGRVPHIDAWIAAWFAREWGTYPNVVLFDGAVEDKYDLIDPSWAKGLHMPVGESIGHALRWGRRVMVGAEVPMDVKAVRVRTHAQQGETEVGQYADIDIESGLITAVPMQHTGARHPPIEIQNLRLGADPGGNGIDPQKPSFEAEVRLPPLPATGPYVVRVSWGYVTANGTEWNAPGIDTAKPETWTVLPDSDVPPPAPPAPVAPPAK